MSEKQKPQPHIVHVAAQILNGTKTPTKRDAERMAARILDDQKNDPQPHRPIKRK